MFNKSTLILFVALSIGLWLGVSLPLFSDAESTAFTEELLKLNNIAGALIGGAVGAIVSYYFEKRRKKGDSDA
jgi:hypothetical protein